MPTGTVRVWIDGVAFESTYANVNSRQKAITDAVFHNALIGSHIVIDIIPSLHHKEHYVTEEAKKGSYSYKMWERNCQTYKNRTRGLKTFYRPGSKTKKGVCFKCIGVGVYFFSDNSIDHSVKKSLNEKHIS